MASKYTRGFSFSGFQANQPRQSLPGQRLDIELDAIAAGLDDVRAKSAYDLAVAAGFTGTLAQWLSSLTGPAGRSAYEVAVAAGFVGTQAAWLASLVGPSGASAYALAVSQGFAGTLAQWLASLRGADGAGATVGTGPGTVAAGNDSRIIGALQKASNGSDIADKPAFRTALGLGGAALANVGTAAGSVAAGNDSRFPIGTLGQAAYRDVGTAAGSVAAGNDTRFPTQSVKGAAYLDIGTAAGTVAAGDDTRLAAVANKLNTNGSAGALTVQSGTPASPALRTIPAAIFRRHDVRDYNGLDMTGNNDCASIVQTAFNASKTAGKVWVPNGDIALGSPINLATGGSIQGDGTRVTSGNNPDGAGGYGLGERGPVFVLGHSGPGFYSPRGVNPNSDGQYNQVVLQNFTTRRIQPSFDTPGDWAPNDAHDFDFILTDRTLLRDIHILNATRGVKIGNSVYGYVDLFNVTGLAATEWLSVNESPNFLRFRNMTCFCDWVLNNNPYFLKYKKWSFNNLVAYKLGRCDELIMSNCTASFAKNGMLIQNNVANNGSVAGGIHDFIADTCVYPLIIQGNGANVAFTGRTGLGSVLSDGGNQIPNGVNFAVGAPNQIKGSLNRVTIDNFDAGFSQTALLDSKGEQNDVHIKAAKIIDWDRARAGAGAFTNNDTGSGPLYVDSVFPMRRTEDNGKKIYGNRAFTVTRASPP